MKKIVSIITIFLVLFALTFSINVYAESLDSYDISTDKQIVHPGENVSLVVNFGQDLGSYDVNVAYDNNLLEYVSVEGGTANDIGSKVIVSFYDATTPRNNMKVTFKAKEQGITTSNPTDLSVTLESLASPDASITYDDITTPIIKNIIVEPVYVDYNIALNYTGDILVNEEKDMEIVISSTMGKNYEHTRIVAEVTAPANETVKLLATDSQNLEHDIIQSGWGDADGEAIGGQNVEKKIQARGVFSGSGDYSITLKLIDRDNSDAVIASKAFTINVKTQEQINNSQEPTTQTPSTESKTTPETLPKTGNTLYFVIIPIIAVLVIAYALLRKKH